MSVDPAGLGAFAYSRPVPTAPRCDACPTPPEGRLDSLGRPAYSYTAQAAMYASARRDARPPRRLGLPIFSIVSVMIFAILIVPTAARAMGGGALHFSDYQSRSTTASTILDAPAPPEQPPRAAAGGKTANPKPTAASVEAPNIERPAVSRRLFDYNLLAPPSISAAMIDSVLASYSSPAADNGATFYDLGLKYGIDPAYALAFYIHESSAGTKGVARFTHGIGNIRTTPGYADYEGYRSYASYAEGIEDWFKLIKELYIGSWGLATPDAIIPRYAPWGDNNNPSVYAASVKSLVDSWQTK